MISTRIPVHIPKQLKTPRFRFVRIHPGTKRPEGIGWQSDNNYSFISRVLKGHMNTHGIYGVVCGYDNLVVIDFDDPTIQGQVFPELPDTFTVRSGGRGLYHLYLKLDRPIKKIRIQRQKESQTITLADIQGTGSQVIGPYSYHPETGDQYTVVKNRPIAQMSIESLSATFEPYAVVTTDDREKSNRGNLCKSHEYCPFHADTDPSVAVYPNQTFYCFGCGAFGFVDALNNPKDCFFKETKNGYLYYRYQQDVPRYQKLMQTQ